MSAKITKEIAFARHQMFNEACEHLDQDVTNNFIENEEKKFVQKTLTKYSNKWFDKYIKLKNANSTKSR